MGVDTCKRGGAPCWGLALGTHSFVFIIVITIRVTPALVGFSVSLSLGRSLQLPYDLLCNHCGFRLFLRLGTCEKHRKIETRKSS